ncbi:PA14 domain-containing protein [Nannocystis exedens]|uniref:PA14 domain-containing protein n=1 Tax=Nannocystis exedens TaxID=54 RepID=A0A1I1WAX6_9BACT|nr:PA14 domain-containing protein [Nannocystis exedens]PCC67533.1 serine protease [Nannocystis exedens]SFD91548.1 PA14 domain-containing protein [Nannocystis exedens]
MLRTSVILVASFGLLAGCASSSANAPQSNSPDAGKVDYDVGTPSGGSGGSSTPADGDGDGGSEPAIKGRDSTTTRGASVGPKVVKRIAASKPPKAEEPETPAPAKPKPGRVVSPNGLLGEAFSIPAATEKLPDFAGLTPTKAFIASGLDASATAPVVGLPKGVAAPIALRFTGSVNVVNAGEYKLCATSDDGSQLYIEDTLIVDNDGVKTSAAEVCELVSLDPGEYKLELRSFHTSAPIVVGLSWAEGKDGTPAAIPLKSLYKPEGADARAKAGK